MSMRPPAPKKSLRSQTVLAAGLGVALILGATVVGAQTQPLQPVQWDNRRLDQLDRNVRRLERALTQRNAAGQPVLVEPDPEVVTLQSRVDIIDRRLSDTEATLQRVNADLERLTFQLDESQRDNTTLADRLRDAEGRLEAAETAAREAAARREAEAQAAASPTGSPAGDMAAARALTGDAALGAYERLIANWSDTLEAQEAEWRSGDILRSGGDQGGSVAAYARALRGWPTAAWAGEVTIKLARGLIATDRTAQACTALGEFDRRYAAAASQDLRAVAARVRGQAECA